VEKELPVSLIMLEPRVIKMELYCEFHPKVFAADLEISKSNIQSRSPFADTQAISR